MVQLVAAWRGLSGAVGCGSGWELAKTLTAEAAFGAAFQPNGWNVGGRLRAVDVAGIIRATAYGLIAILLLYFTVRLLGATPQVFFWPDSWGYFSPAARHAAGEAFTGTLGRTVAYPALLDAVVSLGDLRKLYVAQSILAIAGVLAFVGSLFVVVRQSRQRTFGLILAAGFTLLLVSYQPLTNYVSFAMPEVLYIALSLIVALITLAALASDSATTQLILFVPGVLLSVINCLVKPHWWGAAIVSIAMLVGTCASAMSRERRLGFAALIIALAGSALLISEQWNFSKDDASAATFGPLTLFCNHLDVVRPSLDGAIPSSVSPAARQELLAEIDKVLAATDDVWPLNQVNGDKCMYNTKLNSLLTPMFGEPRDIGRFARSAFISGVENRPAAYLAKVVRQFMAALVAPFGDPVRLVSADEDSTAIVARLSLPARTLVQDAVSTGTTRPVFERRLAPIEYQATRVLFIANHFAIYLFAAALIAAGAALRSDDAVYRRSSLLFVAAFLLYLSSLSVVAVSHTFDIPRYQETTAPLALLSTFASLFALIAAAERLMARAIGGRS